MQTTSLSPCIRIAVQDPNGIILCIYAEREPSPDSRQYHKP
jgi:hypothetical protein